MRRPRNATIIAGGVLVAIAVAGSAWAATLASNSIATRHLQQGAVTSAKVLNGSLTTLDIANGTVRGLDVRANTLTGRHVVESTFTTVPSAKEATTAKSADTAGSVDGHDLVPVDYAASGEQAERTIFEGAGLKLTATCKAGPALDLVATTTVPNSTLVVHTTDLTTGGPASYEKALADLDFGTGETFTDFGESSDLRFRAADGRVVTGTLERLSGANAGTGRDCLAYGTFTVRGA
jgi:hypothetical protein